MKDLAVNNNKEWFHENKKRYEAHLKKPWYSFVDHMLEKAKSIDDGIDISAKDAVFRINRDIRFSKDKHPYKDHIAAVIGRGGRKRMDIPGLYVQFSVEKCMLAGGLYNPDKEQLLSVRRAIMNNYNEVMDILNDSTFKKTFGELEGERNKILPAEFKEEARDKPLLYLKQFHFWTTYEDDKILLRDDLDEFLLEHMRIGRQWNEWLDKVLFNEEA